MSKCFIFSNCRKNPPAVCLENIRKLHIDQNDTIFFLNNAYILYDHPNYFKQFHNTEIYMRNCSVFGLEGWFGYNNANHNRNLFKSINGMAERGNEIIIYCGDKATNRTTCNRYTISEIVSYKEKTGKSPTTGYIAYIYSRCIRKFDPKDIILVNFYGDADNSTPKDVTHDWRFENDWLKTCNRVFV